MRIKIKAYYINLFLSITILAFLVQLCIESVRFGNGSIFGPFMMFTNDSNLFLAVSCGILGILQWKAGRRETAEGERGKNREAGGQFPGIPAWAYLLKYMAVCQVILTCLVVLVFLVGIVRDFALLGDLQMIYYHIITPVAGTLSWLLLEADEFTVPWKIYLPAPLGPLFLYAVIYVGEVVATGCEKGGWKDFYHLNIGGTWPLSFLAIHLLMLGISLGLSMIMGRSCKRKGRKQKK